MTYSIYTSLCRKSKRVCIKSTKELIQQEESNLIEKTNQLQELLRQIRVLFDPNLSQQMVYQKIHILTNLLTALFLYFRKRKKDGSESFSIHEMMQWTNLKAALADAGTGGSYYPDFKPFN
jgi:hypothetical protein